MAGGEGCRGPTSGGSVQGPQRAHRRSIRLAALAVGLLLVPAVGQAARAAAPAPPAEPFRWVEASIEDIHAGLVSGSLTCEQVVSGYLARIAAYDRQGPALQSVIATNPAALDDARALDAAAAAPLRPLHCVPLLLKDNVDAGGLPTTGGARVLASARPPDDAFVVSRLRAAGAIVLGKANMDEFAFGFTGSSSLGGQVRNPYDLTRGPGGSSSGTGASVAASLALAGLGTDTGGSIRVPSSAQGLVGIRPSLRLLSQDGILPLAHFQDTVGPMCRTVQDCAALLAVMVGYDPSAGSGQHTQPLRRDDQAVRLGSAEAYRAVTGLPAAGDPYAAALRPDGLQGARVGVVRALFGSNSDVVGALNAAIEVMRREGAVVEDVAIPDLSTITGYASVSKWEFRDHLTEYLSSWPSTADSHPRSFEEVAVSLGYEQARAATFATNGVSGATRRVDPDYEKNTTERAGYVRPRLLAALQHTDLAGSPQGDPYDVLLYPSVLTPPAVGAAPSTGSNNRLSPFSGLPALSMPAGATPATPARPALPIGMELLGREFAEATLLRIAYGYQSAVAGSPQARPVPPTTPELSSASPST